MIFRKPFAFFIKHFKFVHLVLMLCAIFLVIKTNHILSFFLEYMDIMTISPGSSISTDLFSSTLLFSIIIIIVGSSLVAFLMKNKEKPILFYAINIMIYLFLAVVYSISYHIVQSLEVGLVDIRTLKLLQDFLVVVFILQIFSVIILGVRTLGFDVKKFNFERDLEVLNITSEDNEEVELNVEFDVDKLKRNARKKIRHLKYVYAENKLILNIVLGIFLGILIVLTYLQIGVYHKTYLENHNFRVANYQMNIKNTYIVTKDYHGNTIDDDATFVLAEIQLTGNSKRKFEKARLALQINNHLFYHQKDYKEEFIDLGNIYLSEYLDTEKQNYLFVFKIPNSYKNKKMTLKYCDYNNKTVSIRIKPNRFSKSKTYSFDLGEAVSFEDSILKNTTLQIESVKIQNIMKHEYDFCLEKNQCTKSYEYIVPTYTGNSDKSLLKIVGKLKLDGLKQLDNIHDLFDFIQIYGTFRYTLNGKEKEMTMDLKQVKPHKNVDSDTYYIEIEKEMEEADHIYLDFHIRDKVYQYTVK